MNNPNLATHMVIREQDNPRAPLRINVDGMHWIGVRKTKSGHWMDDRGTRYSASNGMPFKFRDYAGGRIHLPSLVEKGKEDTWVEHNSSWHLGFFTLSCKSWSRLGQEKVTLTLGSLPLATRDFSSYNREKLAKNWAQRQICEWLYHHSRLLGSASCGDSWAHSTRPPRIDSERGLALCKIALTEGMNNG